MRSFDNNPNISGSLEGCLCAWESQKEVLVENLVGSVG